MKTLPLLFTGCLVILINGCQKESAERKTGDILPPGRFGLVVDDTKFDDFRMTSLEIHSMPSDTISYDWNENRHSETMFLLNGMRQGQLIVIASRIVDPASSNTLIYVTFRIKSKGREGVRADGSMSLGGNLASGQSWIFAVSSNTKLADFIQMTATNGVYDTEKALEIGRVDEKRVTLMVGEKKRDKTRFDILPALESPK